MPCFWKRKMNVFMDGHIYKKFIKPVNKEILTKKGVKMARKEKFDEVEDDLPAFLDDEDFESKDLEIGDV